MTTAEFIDLVLTPIGGGIGVTVALLLTSRKGPGASAPSWYVSVAFGAAITAIMLALKFLGVT